MKEKAKIREAEFFLNHIGSADYPKATRYYTSAFLSAARSVLLHAREEALGKGAVGQQWYDTQITVDPLTGVLADYRDTISTSKVDVPESARGGKRSFKYKFKMWGGPEDVLTLCNRYMCEIKRIITDGRQNGFLSGQGSLVSTDTARVCARLDRRRKRRLHHTRLKELARIGLSVNHDRHIDDGVTAEGLDQLNDAQLKGLARVGAYVNHAWHSDDNQSHGRFPSGGHMLPFETCEHPDCRVVRS